MATRRTTRKAAEPAAAAPTPGAKPALKPQDLARFLGLKDFNAEQMQALLVASMIEAQNFIGAEVPAEKQGHVYQQGILHLAAKFYAAGTSKVDGPGDLPMVCRYFFELVRRELSGSAQ
jgi:hypothetical protein